MRLALLGFPLDQALSPVLHRAAYRELGLDWTYEAIRCREEDLPGFLARLDGTWAGFSLTMPLKRAALPLMDEVTPLAAATGAINTIVVAGGRLTGDNTDVAGMLEALREAGAHRPASAVILGAGGTAATALTAISELGLTEATVLARTPSRAEPLRAAANRLGVHIAVRPWEAAPQHINAADLLISAVPPHAADELAPHLPGFHGTLLDVVYHPWPTRLAATAQAAGANVVGGLTMLLHQAARQVTLQTGHAPVPLAAMRAAALAAMNHAHSAPPRSRRA